MKIAGDQFGKSVHPTSIYWGSIMCQVGSKASQGLTELTAWWNIQGAHSLGRFGGEIAKLTNIIYLLGETNRLKAVTRANYWDFSSYKRPLIIPNWSHQFQKIFYIYSLYYITYQGLICMRISAPPHKDSKMKSILYISTWRKIYPRMVHITLGI